MNKAYLHRAMIPDVTEATRPLWSVMIPTYNCADYLRETLKSVLTQAPGAELMQIEVVDDDSTKDDPAAVVAELGQGRVGFYRQPQNVGHTRNFQTCLERAKGRLIHLLHGDDRIRDGFYRKMQLLFDRHPELGAAFCRHIIMDEQGHWQYVSGLEQSDSGILHTWLERIAVEQRIQTPAMVVRREVYEKLGGFDRRLSWCEDWEMWVRIAAHYPVGYEPEPLALYRIHTNSSTGRKTQTGENLRDVRRAIDIFQDYLPESSAAPLVNRARENWAMDTLKYTVPQCLAAKDFAAAIAQIRGALYCSRSFSVLKAMPIATMRLGKRWLKHRLTSRTALYPIAHRASEPL